MSSALLLSLAGLGLVTALIGAMLGYRRRWIEWQAKAQYWFEQSNAHEARAGQYAAMLSDIEREYAADHAVEREAAAWKAGLDPRLANASPEKLRQIVADIFAPVRPSPVQSYPSLEDMVKSTGGRIS